MVMTNLDKLLIGRTGYFFATRRALDGVAIDNLFDEVRDSVENPGPNLIRQVRSTTAGVTYSIICFPYDRLPPFFDDSLAQSDRVHGFMLLIEAPDYLAIIKSRLEIPSSFRSEWLRRIDGRRVQSAIATADAIFQRMRVKPMTTSRMGLSSKSYEGHDLANAMPMSGISRAVPQNYTLRRGTETYSTTPNTGHISLRADKSGYKGAVEWARIVIDAIDTAAPNVESFIESFAQPVDLSVIKDTVNATHIAIDVAELSDRLLETEAKIKLVRKLGTDFFQDLTVKETESVLSALDEEFTLSGPSGNLKIKNMCGAEIGTLKWGKSRISLSTFVIAESKNIYIATTRLAKTPESSVISLKIYLDREDLFLIIFDDISFAYVNGELFEDKTMAGGGRFFLNHLIAAPCLKNATSEKGTFSAGQTQFSDASVFRKVADTISADDDVLICDDLGDEWADFIGLDTTGKPPKISFYHAKHGKLSLGASPFHISVSQAEKNLGRLALPESPFSDKFSTWRKMYYGEKIKTSIPRVVRGGSKAQILNHARKLRVSPETVRRVFIVTSSLSLKNIKKVFVDIKNGEKPTAHFIQLYWLLNSYFSTCAEVGSIGYVVCRP